MNQVESRIKKVLGDSPDILLREFILSIDGGGELKGVTLSIDGLIDFQAIRNDVMKPLVNTTFHSMEDIFDEVVQTVYSKTVQFEWDFTKAIHKVLEGNNYFF